MAEDKDVGEKAKELLVYGPIGLALYVKDTAPSFLKLFVARGRNELDQRKRDVGGQIDQVRAAGEDAATTHGPAVLRIVSEGLQAVRERAEEALEQLGVLANDDAGPRPDPGTGEQSWFVADDAVPTPAAPRAADEPRDEPADDRVEATRAPASVTTLPPRASTTPAAGELPIEGYDDLSASQVVDRLEGLRRESLEAIRAYELGNRARTTILGKIEQLTRAPS